MLVVPLEPPCPDVERELEMQVTTNHLALLNNLERHCLAAPYASKEFDAVAPQRHPNQPYGDLPPAGTGIEPLERPLQRPLSGRPTGSFGSF